MINEKEKLVAESVSVNCYHCGEICEEEINHDDKVFCCHGCFTVYDILKENGLDQYYSLNDSPGIRKTISTDKYNYLENQEIAEQILDFQNDTIAKVTLKLPAIHCSSCIWLLENLVRIRPGIKQSTVNFVKKEATVLFDKNELTLKDLVNFLVSLGYEPDIKLKDQGTSVTKGKSRSLVIKLAVAGFCFGNSMLISLPHYLDTNFLLDASFKSYFGYINLLMGTVVLLYSSSDYFKTAWLGLKRKYLGIDVPISLGIITLYLRTLIDVFQGGAGYADSLTGLIFFLLIGKWYQNKTYQALSFDRDYRSFFPIAVNRINTDNSRSYVQLKDLKKGDKLVIRNEEVIPVDATLIDGDSNVDYSFVTGESDPEKKTAGDKLYAGGRHLGSPVKIEAMSEVSNSYLTSLWNQSNSKTNDQSRLKLVVDKVSAYFTIIVLVIAGFTAIYWAFNDPVNIWNTVTSVLIVACPCALALAVPFTYGHTLRIFGRHGIYLKNANVIERLAKIQRIIFDKTGTLTRTKSNQLIWHGEQLGDSEKSMLFSICWASMHPLSRMICDRYPKMEPVDLEFFDEQKGAGITGEYRGSIVKVGSSSHVGIGAEDTDETRAYFSVNGSCLGYFEVTAAYRPGILSSLKSLFHNYKLSLLSGDNDKEASKLNPYFEDLKFRQKPADKLNYIREANDNGHTAMIGDGLNDAGALREADVGISVVEDLHQFSPACDVIMEGGKLPRLSEYLRFSKLAMFVVYGAFTISFLYNIVGLSFAVAGYLTPLVSAILMPISSVSVVGFVTIAINLIARKKLVQ